MTPASVHDIFGVNRTSWSAGTTFMVQQDPSHPGTPKWRIEGHMLDWPVVQSWHLIRVSIFFALRWELYLLQTWRCRLDSNPISLFPVFHSGAYPDDLPSALMADHKRFVDDVWAHAAYFPEVYLKERTGYQPSLA
jgi:hypothetical protein